MNIILKYIAFIVVVIFILLLTVKINELQKVIITKDNKIAELNNQIAIEIEKQEILQDELYEMRLTMEWYMKNK